MSDLPSINLRNLDYSPTVNPLVESQALTIKRRLVRAGRGEDLINSRTGEIVGVSAIHQIEERDDAEFVKVFAAGVSAAYGLNRTAQRVFQAVLDEYGVLSQNRRNFRHPSSSPATSASRSIILPSLWKV